MDKSDALAQSVDVAAIRKGKGLSQSGFAYLLHVPLRAVQGWESAKRFDSAG